MPSPYNYSIAGDTAAGVYDPQYMYAEAIAALSGTAPTSIDRQGDALSFVYSPDISPAQETLLTAAVNAHTGAPPAGEPEPEASDMTVKSRAPAATDDASAGFFIGARWLDTSVTPNDEYVCFDPSNGAAQWHRTTDSTEVGQLQTDVATAQATADAAQTAAGAAQTTANNALTNAAAAQADATQALADAATAAGTVQVSANDTTPGDLLAKLVAGPYITFTELNDGANETLRIEGDPSISISQAGHGFALTNNVPLPAYVTPGGPVALALADNHDTLSAFFITEITDGNTFRVKPGGVFHDAPGHGLTIGNYYFLSTATAGAVTLAQPVGALDDVVFFAVDANRLLLIDNRPSLGSAASVTHPIFKAHNVDAATDLATAGNVTVPIVGTIKLNEGSGLYVPVGNTGVQVTAAGEFSCKASVHLYAAVAHSNVYFQFAIDGNLTGAISAGNYIRNTSGHQESSDYLEELFPLAAGQTITLVATGEASTIGLTHMAVVDSSYIWVEKR